MSRSKNEILAGVKMVNGYVMVPCSNCGGTGNYPSSMIPAGKCRLYCWQGRTPATYGMEAVRADTYVRRVQSQERAAAKRQAEWEAQAAERAQKQAERDARLANPDARLVALLATYGTDVATVWAAEAMHTFYEDMVLLWVNRGTLSDGQWAAIEADTAKRLSAKPAPSGRFTLEGEVVKVDTKRNDFGTRYVMTVRTADGWLTWGTQPSTYVAKVGDRIRFTATVEPSEKDPAFSFFSRPTKLEVVESKAA